MTGKAMRDLERGLHLAVGVGLLLLVFTPLGGSDVGAALRVALAPLLIATGLLMWQHARVTRLLRRRDIASRTKSGGVGS